MSPGKPGFFIAATGIQPGEIILDNCMGSGTIGVACYNTDRRFIGIEKEPKYFRVAKERIERATAQLKLAF